MEPQDQETAVPHSEGPAWRAALEGKWEALRRQVLALDPTSKWKMAELGQECQDLAAVAAWYEAHGNITRAAERLGTSRRALRERVAKWKQSNPHALPPPLAVHVKPSVRKDEGQPRHIEGEGL